MMFSLVRSLFIIIFSIVCFIFIRKTNITKKRKKIILSILILAFLVVLPCIGPIENAFITFPTAEAAYHYSKEGHIKHIIEGEESDLVIGQKDTDNDNTYIITIMPKTNEGWKISAYGDLKRITSTFTYDISIDVYQYKNSDDYYIMVECIDGSELEIIDNRNSNFDYYEGKNKLNKTYCSYIHGFDENYVITVDGETFSFNNIQNRLNRRLPFNGWC